MILATMIAIITIMAMDALWQGLLKLIWIASLSIGFTNRFIMKIAIRGLDSKLVNGIR